MKPIKKLTPEDISSGIYDNLLASFEVGDIIKWKTKRARTIFKQGEKHQEGEREGIFLGIIPVNTSPVERFPWLQQIANNKIRFGYGGSSRALQRTKTSQSTRVLVEVKRKNSHGKELKSQYFGVLRNSIISVNGIKI